MTMITAGKTAKTSRKDPWYVRGVLIAVTALFLGFMVIGPLVNVFGRAFERGPDIFFAALTNKYTLHALGLTLLAAVLAVGLNLTFGVAAAWAIARFHFRGKALLTSLIDLPFSVSPVIAGLIFVLLFGTYGYFGPMLRASGIRDHLCCSGIVPATTVRHLAVHRPGADPRCWRRSALTRKRRPARSGRRRGRCSGM